MKGILNIEAESLEKIAKDYKKFIKDCSSFSLVLRENTELNSLGKAFINNLAPHLTIIELKNEWPGTILINEKASIYYYRLNQNSLMILNNLNSLFDLVAPSFLEDICFYLNDEPFLVTITHEKDLYFQINEHEALNLKKTLENEGIRSENWIKTDS